MKFKTISKNAIAEIEEKKSRFIASIFYIETVSQAEEYIKKIKKQYHDAKHNCFAYVIKTEDGGTIKKCSDDGEPSGTAGAPILKILTENELTNVLVVVTRYFGGVLLGTGGLVRAYSGVTKEALKNTEFITKINGYEVKIEISYKNLEKIKYELEKKKIKIIKVNYNEKIEILVEIPDMVMDWLNSINNILDIKVQIMTKKFIEI